MSSSYVETIEERFKALRATVTQAEWTDLDWLISLAKRLESSDLALSYRVLQRARNLEPENSKVTEALNRTKRVLKKKHPEALHFSSRIEKLKAKKAANVIRNVSNIAAAQWARFPEMYKTTLFLVVVLPVIVFASYQFVWASERFESQSLVIVKQPDASSLMDPTAALLTGMGMPASSSESMLVEKYIYSADMLRYLDAKLGLREHYSDRASDYFSRLHSSGSNEDFILHYKTRVNVELDHTSNVLTIRVQAYTPEFAQQLNEAIVDRAEWYINNVGHYMAKKQLEFMKQEHDLVENRLRGAQGDLLAFQERYNLLDPTAEGAALQRIAYAIEGQLSVKKAELKALKSIMSDSAPAVLNAQSEIDALLDQLESERNRLSPNGELGKT